MKLRSLILTATMLALTACGGSDRPVYSGKQEPTAGVPGFSSDGQRKLHPNIKLGQSYRVSGKTYVPRYQPDYDEEGMASWYGPGFHGKKTANGEIYNQNDHTAAHTTLPLPSIVKVTYMKTGKSTYARVNDRGPFAHSRIIDLSEAVAEDIGLKRDGVGRVRVQYMPEESFKFVEMITKEGRDPHDIDIASEVVGKKPSGDGEMLYAGVTPADDSIQVTDTMAVDTSPAAQQKPSVWQHMNPISSAQAAEAPPVAMEQAPVGIITPMPPSSLPSGPSVKVEEVAPNVATVTPVQPPELAQGVSSPPPVATPPPQPQAQAPPVTPAVANGPFVQLGAFANQGNAVALQQRFDSLGATSIQPGNVGGIPVYRVRLGPFVNDEAAIEMLERAQSMGVADAKLVTGYH